VTDLGTNGILNFFAKHRCNRYCSSEWALPKECRNYFDAQQSTTLLELPQPKHAPTQHSRQAMTDAQYDQSDSEDEYY
jgi:hypothetical protein